MLKNKKQDININFKYVLFFFSFFIFIYMTAIIKPDVYGDGFEYTYMTQAFENHLTPNVTTKDINDAQVMLRANNINNFPNPYSGFFKSRSGKMYSYHFWLYSLLNLPVKLILKLLNVNQFRCFQITNSVFFILSLWIAFLHMNIDNFRKIFLISLLAVNPVIWYLTWTHPEVLCYSLVIMSLTMFSINKIKIAILLASIASMQNPPLIVLIAIYLIWYLKNSKIKLKETIFLLLLCFPAIIPSIFYYYNFGTANLIMKIGAAGLKYITFQKIYDLVFDLNMGMIVYIPILVILLFVFIVKNIVSKNIKNLLWPLSLLIIIILSVQTANWNSGCSGIMRYSLWMIPIIILYVVEQKEVKSKIYKYLLLLSIVYQLFIVCYGGGFICKITNNSFTPIARYVLSNFPYIYSPEKETFAERTLGRETSYLDKLPIVYSSNGSVTKILTNYEGLKVLKNYYNIKDHVYFNNIVNKFNKTPDRITYVNIPKGKVAEVIDPIRPLYSFKTKLNLLEKVDFMNINSTYKVAVQVINEGNETWPSKPDKDGKYVVNLAYHWLDKNGKVLIRDGFRTNLPYNLRPNTPINVSMNVTTPSKAGLYILEIDLVQESVSWAADKGNKTIRIPVDIK